MTHYVYRLFDADDRCLYVGRSTDYAMRVRRHRMRPWGSQIARVDVTLHASPAQARDRESCEIGRLNPVHNIRLANDGRALAQGELAEIVRTIVEQFGPLTQTEVERQMFTLGYHGQSNAAGTILARLVTNGELAVVDERPSIKGRWKTARVFGVAA